MANLIRQPEVSKKIGLSRTQLYRMVKAGDFPKPKKLGARAVAWKEEDVDAWIEERMESDDDDEKKKKAA